MKTTPKIKMLLIAGAVLGMTSACQKESVMDNGSLNPASEAMKQTLDAVNFTQVISMPLDAALAGSQGLTESSSLRVSACGTVTNDTLSNPKTLTVDYGKTNCRGSDGHYRRGKLILSYTGDLNTPGTVFTYTTEDFYVDNNRYDGSRVVTNVGARTSNFGSNLHLTVIDDYTVTNGFTRVKIRNQGEADQEWVGGAETLTNVDDIFYIDAIQAITSSTGLNMTAETAEFLRQDMNYPYTIFGIMKYIRKDNPSQGFSIDYGYPNRERDNQALVNFNDGSSQVVTLQ